MHIAHDERPGRGSLVADPNRPRREGHRRIQTVAIAIVQIENRVASPKLRSRPAPRCAAPMMPSPPPVMIM